MQIPTSAPCRLPGAVGSVAVLPDVRRHASGDEGDVVGDSLHGAVAVIVESLVLDWSGDSR
jgi:hypothetical protein